MKRYKRSMCLLQAALLLSLTACSGNTSPSYTGSTQPPAQYADPYAGLADYDEKSSAIYSDVLGEFYDAYEVALAERNLSRRWAQMAVAEAKLLESAVMLPTSTQGGRYAISRLAPYTTTNVLWGNDSSRYHQALVTTMPITAAHREEMKTKWAQLKGTGTWEDWAEQYLTDQGYTLKDSYTMSYTSDPKTWDVLNTYLSADAEAIVNTYDGLYAYNTEGVLSPALAESCTVSEDGLQYTFKIRQGIKWVDSQGRPVADVKADDFVAGMQHMMDAQGGLEYLVKGVIANAAEYISGDITDFSQVGVKAVDDATLVYTLEEPASYFMTMLGYNVFAPMSREYYAAQGGKFGAAFDESASDYFYGRSPDNIAYCGPYLVSNATARNTIVFRANPAYWNADNIHVSTITWLYNDGSDPTKAYTDMKAGVLDGCSLTVSTLELARTEKAPGGESWFDTYHYVSNTTATTFSAFYNVNRMALRNTSDQKAPSTKTSRENERSVAAMRNVHFRRAISFAVDRGAYNAQRVGEELKLHSLRNGYTPGSFVALTEEVTIDMGGMEKTYPAGTFFGQIVQDQLDADGVPIRVWDAGADDGLGSGDGFDGWYSPENAVRELETAIGELSSMGVEISAEKPVFLDLPYPANDPNYTNSANAYKQSVESVLGGRVRINLIACTSYDEWYNAGYYTVNGSENNYDIYDLSGWGPDYGDPATYLDTFLPDYAGSMTKRIGIF